MTEDEAIHPRAVVDPRAELGARVRIGAFAVVGREATLADDVEIGHHAVVEGRVILGPGVKIGAGAIVGGAPQDLKFKLETPSGVRIGGGTVVREYVVIHRATTAEGWTEIGTDCLVMAMSHIAHDCRLGHGVVVISYAAITGHCVIGDRATVGGLSGMTPFTRVGSFAYIGGLSRVVADVPPYMIVVGQPATVRGVNVVGLRRAGIEPADRRLLQDAHRILYREGLSPRRAVERIRETLPATPPLVTLLDFIAGSRRGICGPPGHDDEAGLAVSGRPSDSEGD